MLRLRRRKNETIMIGNKIIITIIEIRRNHVRLQIKISNIVTVIVLKQTRESFAVSDDIMINILDISGEYVRIGVTALNELLFSVKELTSLVNQKTNENVKYALHLFIQLDDGYKKLILRVSNFNGFSIAKHIYDHFNTMGVLMLRDCVENMEYRLK